MSRLGLNSNRNDVIRDYRHNPLDVRMDEQVSENANRNEKKVYEASDIMEILGIGRSKAYEFLREVSESEKPPFRVIKVGKLVRVPKKSFDEWLDQCGGAC